MFRITENTSAQKPRLEWMSDQIDAMPIHQQFAMSEIRLISTATHAPRGTIRALLDKSPDTNGSYSPGQPRLLLMVLRNNHENNTLTVILPVAAAVRKHCSGGCCCGPFRIPSPMERSNSCCTRCRGNSMEHVGSHGVGQKEVSTTERPDAIHPHSGSLLCRFDFCWNVLR